MTRPDSRLLKQLCLLEGADGAVLRLNRERHQSAAVAYDPGLKHLVELHVVGEGVELGSEVRERLLTLMGRASGVRSALFPHVLGYGEDEGCLFYCTNLRDGEDLGAYLGRVGALAPCTAFALMVEMLDGILAVLPEHEEWVSQLQLEQVVVTCVDDAYLQLCVADLGLDGKGRVSGEDAQRVVVGQSCRMLYWMLVGTPWSEGKRDEPECLTRLPAKLRGAMRSVLQRGEFDLVSVVILRDALREAFSAVAGRMAGGFMRKPLFVTEDLRPHSALASLLPGAMAFQSLLDDLYLIQGVTELERSPLSVPVVSRRTGEAMMMHLMPPKRLLGGPAHEVVPLSSWRFDVERHPNILTATGVWEGKDWTVVTEAKEEGLPLGRLLAERHYLNAPEVVLVVRQVQAALRQARECGVRRIHLGPVNLLLEPLVGMGQKGLELDRLLQRRLDSWPEFRVKVRAFLTMPNLLSSSLHAGGRRLEDDEAFENSSLMLLGIQLLTGCSKLNLEPVFPDTVPDGLQAFLLGGWQRWMDGEMPPTDVEVLEAFDVATALGGGGDLRSRLVGAPVVLEELECVGSVSDFEEDWESEFESGGGLGGADEVMMEGEAGSGDPVVADGDASMERAESGGALGRRVRPVAGLAAVRGIELTSMAAVSEGEEGGKRPLLGWALGALAVLLALATYGLMKGDGAGKSEVDGASRAEPSGELVRPSERRIPDQVLVVPENHQGDGVDSKGKRATGESREGKAAAVKSGVEAAPSSGGMAKKVGIKARELEINLADLLDGRSEQVLHVDLAPLGPVEVRRAVVNGGWRDVTRVFKGPELEGLPGPVGRAWKPEKRPRVAETGIKGDGM